MRMDVRAHSHVLGSIVQAGIHPFAAGEVRESCVLVTGTSQCRGVGYDVPAVELAADEVLDDDDGNGVSEGGDRVGAGGQRRSEL